ncbi:hypothetical protein [Aquabacter spiritensis]|uniref:AMIN domain-containing protein n=1 Tax=Aquabacter spiritensis TaxID=933073 RepID=A0A4R3M167_9HYPH|nr:hypothetical protein [Aquabacter spiritensis]TCT06851.1 hypothetical protein EDC64_102332 [Aquabacter spiritensis]
MRLIASLAGLVLAASGVAAFAQTPPAAPTGAQPAMTQAGTPQRPEIHISRPIEMVLIEQAAGMSFDGKTLTLTGVPPVASFRVDRPERIGGTMTTEQFVKIWNATVRMFKNDPPNAALTILGPQPTQVIVELGSVTQNGTTLVFNAGLLDGDIPSSGGPVNLVTAPTVYRPLEGAGTFLKCWWSPYWVERVCRAGW